MTHFSRFRLSVCTCEIHWPGMRISCFRRLPLSGMLELAQLPDAVATRRQIRSAEFVRQTRVMVSVRISANCPRLL